MPRALRSLLSAGARPPDSAWEAAKQLAVLCMALNHIALVLPAPWPEWGLLAGRLSLPVFSLLLLWHLQQDTQARAERYLPRLLGWALLSQPVYALLINGGPGGRLNALATLASGVCLIYLADRLGAVAALLAAALVIEQSRWLDGGAWMPVGLLLVWYGLRHRPRAWPAAVLVISLLGFGMNAAAQGQVTAMAWVALLLPPLAMALSPRLSPHLRRWPRGAYYAFYPLHLALILAWHGPL